MVDITEISAVVAAAGVLVGVIYYILDMRNQAGMRQTDLLMRMYLAMGSEDMNKARLRFLALKITTYDDFKEKYGPPFSAEPSQEWIDLDKIGWFYNGLGLLVHRQLASVELVEDFLGYGVVIAWERIGPLAYGWRKEYNMPKSFGWFEYLYNEMKKREQSGIRNG
jgi:xanthosine utilization system XapX-like protein